MTVLEALNLLTLLVVATGIVLIFLKLLRRTWLYVTTPGFGWRKLDPLLIKDFILYLVLTIVIGGSMYARLVDGEFRTEPWWIIATNSLALLAIGVGLWVEYFYVEDPNK